MGKPLCLSLRVCLFRPTIIIKHIQYKNPPIFNPKGWDFYVEDGTWSDEEVSAIKKKAKDAIEQDALQYGILQKASQSGEKKLRALLMSLGFNDVIFNN